MDVKVLDEIKIKTGLNRTQLAARLGVSRQALQQMDRLKGSVRTTTLIKLWHIARDDLKWSAAKFMKELEKEG